VTSVRRIETANSIWFFDEDRSQFRRVPRDAEEVFARFDDWEPYYGLEIDAETGAFTVLLDPDGTRRYRSWRVDDEAAAASPAAASDGDATEEMPLLPAQDARDA
jgi:hypothetical protein